VPLLQTPRRSFSHPIQWGREGVEIDLPTRLFPIQNNFVGRFILASLRVFSLPTLIETRRFTMKWERTPSGSSWWCARQRWHSLS
jgi:hypothetical protein